MGPLAGASGPASRSSWSAPRCWRRARDGQPRPVARASGWRLQTLDTAALAHACAPLPRPLREARSRDMAKNWDRNYVHSLDWRWLTKPLNDGPGESWIKPIIEPGQRRDDDAAGAAVRGRRLRQRHRHEDSTSPSGRS